MARLPDGDPAPRDGALPAPALAELPGRTFGVYVHVPFCATRCGYCDFNTYTPGELRGGATRAGYVDAALAEIELAARVLGPDRPAASTVFLGGGTPTLLAPGEIARLIDAIGGRLGLAAGAEVTVEANPETVDPPSLAALRAAGVTRISLGMQHAAPHVLAVLDRVHTPGRAVAAAREARAAGFAHVSLDLIYGTPGETAEDWEATLAAALDARPDHVSAYALIVEPGTRLAARVRRGELPLPDDDAMADRYAAADAAFTAAGLGWYEVSNWGAPCRHNMGYWTGGSWWGVGPGAHSHVGGVRWWNALHPQRWTDALASGASPAAGREVLDAETRRCAGIMLVGRLREGLPLGVLHADARAEADRLAAEGLLDRGALAGGRAVPTLRGRLLADAVVRALT